MWTRGITSMLCVPAMLLAVTGHAAGQSDPASLPGRVVDVKAGEFFLQATDTIPAGLTTFRLLQTGLIATRLKSGLHGRALVADQGDNTRGFHMLWVVRLDSGKTLADLYRAAQAGERMTPWARQMGGPAFSHPPSTTNATIDLMPGNYALVCYVGSARADRARYHLLNGMARALSVMPSSQPRSALPRVDVIATISDSGIVKLSGPLHAGEVVVRVENETDKDWEWKLQRVPDGLTGKAFLAQLQDAEPGKPAGGLSSVPSRASVMTTLYLAPGEYIVGTHPPIRHPTSQVVTVTSRPRE